MDLSPSARTRILPEATIVFPVEMGAPLAVRRILEGTDPDARRALHAEVYAFDDAPLAERARPSPLMAPGLSDGAAPHSGDLELLPCHVDVERQRRLERPLDAEVRTTFLMAEPDDASTDRHMAVTVTERDRDDPVREGAKWCSSEASCRDLHHRREQP
jgi:hypothetical protein